MASRKTINYTNLLHEIQASSYVRRRRSKILQKSPSFHIRNKSEHNCD